MTYEVLLDGKSLYYPDDSQSVIINAKLELALNDSGTFECDVPVTNPLYDAIENRRSMVQVIKNGKEIFYGEVRECEETIDLTKHVYAVGELAFLFDSIQPQGKYQDHTPLQFFSVLLNHHNSQVETKKQFQLGVVTVSDPNDSIYRFTNFEDTLTCMRDKLCNGLSGYLRVRKVNGVRYLDLVRLTDYGNTCLQAIEFGENLLDYACNASGTDIVTAVIPLGAQLEESPIEGLDAYTDIAAVNNGVNYVYLPEAVARFGWVKRVVHWDNVTEPANLKTKAEKWLSENQYELLTLEVNAVDLSMLNSDIDSFDLGDSVRALAEPFGMDARFPVQKMTLYLQEPAKNTIVLSNTLKKSYTQQVTDLTNQITGEMPKPSSILQQAKKNASNLIKAATTGFIVLNMDDKGNPKEILIMDTKDIDTAQRVWRWNINGLGYSSNGYNGDFGLAMTMDGAIVADFVTTGTMFADRIKGGSLKLGGFDNVNGVLIMQDSSGKEVGRWDKDGITFPPGTKISWTDVSEKPDVALKDDIPSDSYITEITENTIKTRHLVANNLDIKGGTFRVETAPSNENLIFFRTTYAGDDKVKHKVDAAMGSYGFIAAYDEANASTVMWNGVRIPGGGYLSYDGANSVVAANIGYIGTLVTASAAATSSDANLKNSIEVLDAQKSADFIYALTPRRFKYNDGTSGRYHHGLIAQEVKAAMGGEDWGVFVDGISNPDGNKYAAVRYEELISDLIATVQLLKREIDTMKVRISDE